MTDTSTLSPHVTLHWRTPQHCRLSAHFDESDYDEATLMRQEDTLVECRRKTQELDGQRGTWAECLALLDRAERKWPLTKCETAVEIHDSRSVLDRMEGYEWAINYYESGIEEEPDPDGKQELINQRNIAKDDHSALCRTLKRMEPQNAALTESRRTAAEGREAKDESFRAETKITNWLGR